MKRFFLCFSFVCCIQTLLGQESDHTSTITLSAGGQPYSYNFWDDHGGPAFDGRYEFRLWKYLALEAGVDTLLPETHRGEYAPVISNGQVITGSLGLNCKACVLVVIPARTQATFVPFGAKGILPVADGRLELFVGVGGAYSFYPYIGLARDALLSQASLGGRMALDRRRHFWLGTSARGYSTGYSNSGYRTRQTWLSWTADLGLRFGH